MAPFKRVSFLTGAGGLLAAAFLVFVACEDKEGSPSTATPTATVIVPAGSQAQRPATAQEVQELVVSPTDSVIEVAVQDNAFTTNHFLVGVGESVNFKVTNNGNNPHTFTIAGLDGQFGTADDITTDNIAPGEEEDLPVILNVAGTYVFRCNIHTTQMWGQIDVGAAQAGAAPHIDRVRPLRYIRLGAHEGALHYRTQVGEPIGQPGG